ncbi:MAG: hypothetical protein O7G30_19280 [Proteobacteria bacterium]|nr:hypothetical protein [Pseudomonadota bacterium]
MSESKEERVSRLLNEGLEHYGMGEVAKAILVWEEVLVLEPKSADAVDYIRTADRRKHPRPPKNAAGSGDAAIRSIAEEAQTLIQAEGFEEALDLLRSAAEAQPTSLEIQANLELVRSRLYRRYRERVGDLEQVAVLNADPNAITKFNLPSDAGFMLSMIDGATSVEDLISLSGVDAFEALRLLQGLLDTGIVVLKA